MKKIFILIKTKTQLLDLSTSRLQLRSAARRFYTQDGTLILDVQDLIDWCLDHYRKENRKLEKGIEKIFKNTLEYTKFYVF